MYTRGNPAAAPRIVQEATDRDTVLGLVQCRIGLALVTESTRWHCPTGIVLLPVVDMNVRLPFNVIWKKNNSSPVLQKFLAQVQAVALHRVSHPRQRERAGPIVQSALQRVPRRLTSRYRKHSMR
jgi:DNA-binding transcriptional LysR family regulator